MLVMAIKMTQWYIIALKSPLVKLMLQSFLSAHSEFHVCFVPFWSL